MNYYPHHIGDYAKDTGHLTLLEHGAYRQMMDIYYSTEKPLPLDRAKLYRLLRATAKQERSTVDSILVEFFLEREDGWHHKRCDCELAKAAEKSEKARQSALVSVSKRSANAERTLSERSANVELTNNQEPITNNQKPRTKNQDPPLSDKQKATGKKRGAFALAYDRPAWLPEIWETYLQLRREKGASLAPTWLAASLKQLDGWRSQGYDIAAILQNSVNNGYTGLFPPKANGSSGSVRDAGAEWLRGEQANFIDGESERLPDA